MPAVIPFIPLIAAGVAGGTAVAGAKMQSNASNRGAQLQTQASNYAAQQQSEAARSTEQFLRQQAQAQWQSDETDRRANYDQWASRERRLGSVGEILGWGPRDIPAYVPSQDPRLNPTSPGAALRPATQRAPNGAPLPPQAPRPPMPRRTAGSYLAQRSR